MSNEGRPQRRPYRREPKPPSRTVQLTMEFDLYDALELVRDDLVRRDVSDTMHLLLEWAVWAHSTGRNPFHEMVNGERRGFADWDARIRAKREARALEHLYKLGELKDGAK